MPAANPCQNIVFVHPDLGIGGAERLVIDAAVGLQSQGHKVTILTSYCNKAHCFEEARDGTLDVRVRGDAIFPPSIAGRLSILFAILRQLALVASTSIFSSELKQLAPDVFFVDQLSACVPFFRLLFPRAKVLFYCHYPDKLLIRQETGIAQSIKKLYRIPFDAIEGWSTACSDVIVVNSKYTRSVVRSAFKSLKARDLRVVYPCVDTTNKSPVDTASAPWLDKKLLLSINRFERKKNLALAIRAYAKLSADERGRARMVLAGGFDPRNPENSTTLGELKELASSQKLEHTTLQGKELASDDVWSRKADVYFLLSISSDLKEHLLRTASILIYTPTNEHFGIVPLEAMLAGVPVLATNTGGPLETIYDQRTGWLISPEKIDKWTDVMRKPLIPSSADHLKSMGQKGRERVLHEFSHTKMTETLDKEIQNLVASADPRPEIVSQDALIGTLGILIAISVVLVGIIASSISRASMRA